MPDLKFLRLEFMKKTSVPHHVKSLGHNKCYSSRSPKPIKCPINSIRYDCKKKSTVEKEHLNPYWEIRKKAIFLEVINKPVTYVFSNTY